jgi:putative two-component system response regulator
VADLIESMVSHRPYRPALCVEAALAELALGRGTKYDVAVADACIALFKEEPLAKMQQRDEFSA